ncbi:MAG: hypothetical protein O3C28_20840, partial [Proteobacteria bacterium]|nr:hypothetical protein [Pseudomonadota bacterium]
MSPFAKPLGITGEIRHASFKLTTGRDQQLLLEPIEPLDVRRLGIVDGATHLLNNVWLSIRPTVNYTPESIDVQYRELILSGGKNPIAKGSGTVRVKTQKDHAATLRADGDLHLDLGNFGTQPIFADVLSDIAVDRSLSAKLRYDPHYAGASVHIDSLNFDLLHERTSYVQIEVADGLTLKPTLAAGDSFAQYATGEIELSIKDLSSNVVDDVFPLGNLSFDTINGLLNLTSDGTRLFAETAEPLVVKQVKLMNTDRELQFKPFTFRTSGSIELVKQTIKTTLDKLAVQFQNEAAPALSGRLSATIEPAQTDPLQQLNADINGALPQLLNQPAVLPQHSLTQGTITATVGVDPQGNISAITRIENLAASKPLAIHTIALPLTGNMRPDGNGFDFTMPLVGVGSSGNSDSFTVGDYLPQAGKPTLLRLSSTSKVFYLND